MSKPKRESKDAFLDRMAFLQMSDRTVDSSCLSVLRDGYIIYDEHNCTIAVVCGRDEKDAKRIGKFIVERCGAKS